MIKVKFNGEDKSFPQGTTVEDLLIEMEVKRSHLAVELNRQIVPRTKYNETVLENGDVLEIVSLAGGG